MSIYSTDLYQGVIIPILGNQSIGLIVRAGGTLLYYSQDWRSTTKVSDFTLQGKSSFSKEG